jgi:ABC-2 type transport system ATP-binding protein
MLRAGRLVDRGPPAGLLARYGRQNMEEVFIDIARQRRLEINPDSQQVAKQ